MQLLVTVAVPVALWAATPGASHAEECTCEHPSSGVCPMHRHSSTSSSSSSTACSVRGALDPLDALVASMIGPVGVMPGFVTTANSIETGDRLPDLEQTALDRPAPPDSPPPRA